MRYQKPHFQSMPTATSSFIVHAHPVGPYQQAGPSMRIIQTADPAVVEMRRMAIENESFRRQLVESKVENKDIERAHVEKERQLQQQIFTLQAEKQRHSEDLARLQKEHDDHSKQHRHFKSQHEATSARVVELQKELDDAKAKLREKSEELTVSKRSYENKMASFENKFHEKELKLIEQIEKIETQLTNTVPQLTAMKNELHGAKVKNLDLERQLATKVADLEKCKTNLEKSKQLAMQHEQAQKNTEAKYQVLKESLDNKIPKLNATIENQKSKHTSEIEKLGKQISNQKERLESAIPLDEYSRMLQHYRNILNVQRENTAGLYKATKVGKITGFTQQLNASQRKQRADKIEEEARNITRLQFKEEYPKVDPGIFNSIVKTAAHFQNKYTNQEFNMENERGLYCAHKM